MENEGRPRDCESAGRVCSVIGTYWQPRAVWQGVRTSDVPTRQAICRLVGFLLLVIVSYVLLNLSLAALAYMVSPVFSVWDMGLSDIAFISVRAASEVLVFFIWACVSLGMAFAIGGDIRLKRSTMAEDGTSLAWFAARWMLWWVLAFSVLWHPGFATANTQYYWIVSFGCAFLFVLLVSVGLAVFSFRYFFCGRWEGRWRRCGVFAVVYAVACAFLYREMWFWGGRIICRLLHLPRWRSLTLWMYPDFWDYLSRGCLWRWLPGD